MIIFHSLYIIKKWHHLIGVLFTMACLISVSISGAASKKTQQHIPAAIFTQDENSLYLVRRVSSPPTVFCHYWTACLLCQSHPGFTKVLFWSRLYVSWCVIWHVYGLPHTLNAGCGFSFCNHSPEENNRSFIPDNNIVPKRENSCFHLFSHFFAQDGLVRRSILQKCREENGPPARSWALFLLFLWRSSSWLVALLVPVVWCCSGIRLQKPLFCSRSVTQQMWSDGRSGDGKRFHLASLRTSIVLKGQVHAPRWSSQTIPTSVNL